LFTGSRAKDRLNDEALVSASRDGFKVSFHD
jgi:hypothetical protein